MICMASHTMTHMVPSVYSPDNCCCRRIPLRESALPSYPYAPGRMLVACPLIPVWSSLTDHLSVGGKLYSWSAVCRGGNRAGRAGLGRANTGPGQNWAGLKLARFFRAKILTAQPALKTGPVWPNSHFKAKKNSGGPGRAIPGWAIPGRAKFGPVFFGPKI